MRYFVIPFFLLFFCTCCNGQSDFKNKKDALSFELGKTGLIYNVNFDHKFPKNNFGYRFGFGSNFDEYLNFFTVGGGVYYLVGENKNFLETGVDVSYITVNEKSDDQRGVTLVYPNYATNTPYTSINIGFRRYGRGSLFRIGPSFGFIKDGFVAGGYISYGFLFK